MTWERMSSVRTQCGKSCWVKNKKYTMKQVEIDRHRDACRHRHTVSKTHAHTHTHNTLRVYYLRTSMSIEHAKEADHVLLIGPTHIGHFRAGNVRIFHIFSDARNSNCIVQTISKSTYRKEVKRYNQLTLKDSTSFILGDRSFAWWSVYTGSIQPIILTSILEFLQHKILIRVQSLHQSW